MSQAEALQNNDKQNLFLPPQSLYKGNRVLDDSLVTRLPRRSSITSEEDEPMDERLFCQKITFQRERQMRGELTISLFPCL